MAKAFQLFGKPEKPRRSSEAKSQFIFCAILSALSGGFFYPKSGGFSFFGRAPAFSIPWGDFAGGFRDVSVQRLYRGLAAGSLPSGLAVARPSLRSVSASTAAPPGSSRVSKWEVGGGPRRDAYGKVGIILIAEGGFLGCKSWVGVCRRHGYAKSVKVGCQIARPPRRWRGCHQPTTNNNQPSTNPKWEVSRRSSATSPQTNHQTIKPFFQTPLAINRPCWYKISR